MINEFRLLQLMDLSDKMMLELSFRNTADKLRAM